MKQNKKSSLKKGLVLGIIIFLCLLFSVSILIRYYIQNQSRKFIYNSLKNIPNCNVALVLGAKIDKNGNPSTLLADRIGTASELYKLGKVKKLLLSGDNRFSNYNEPEKMRDYAMKLGVPGKDIVLDYAGRRTYDSIYRAKHIFGQSQIIIVSQKFHLERAIFLSKHIGISAFGANADVLFHKNNKAEIREFPACLSAFLDVYILSPKPITGKIEKIDI